MTRPKTLMEAVSANLNWFLQPIGENLSKPQKKFLREGLVGLLRARRVVCRMARKLPAIPRGRGYSKTHELAWRPDIVLMGCWATWAGGGPHVTPPLPSAARAARTLPGCRSTMYTDGSRTASTRPHIAGLR